MDGLALGLAQAAALAPGVSRNGATLTAARWRGFTRQHSNMLSRTVALPVIVGAAVLKGIRLRSRGLPPEARASFAAGTATSFASTLASQELIRVVERDSALWPYAAYRAGLAATVLAGLWRRRRAPRTAVRLRQRPAGGLLARPSQGGHPGVSEDAYAKAGVSQGDADAAVASLVAALAASPPAESRQVLASGHYANVVRLNDETGIALSTDGVGTKLVLAEQLGRWDTVGIDCVAMNVNDVVCVGAEPLAMVDYLAVDRADAEIAGAVGVGLARGAELAGIEIVGGELAQLGELINGLDLAGACFGVVQLDSLVTGAAIEPGDAVIGLPSSGLHSNGYTLARKALADIPLDDERIGRPLGDILLEPTEIYVKPVLELLRSPLEVRGLAHITSGGLDNLLRLEAGVSYEIDQPLPVPEVFELIRERGEVSDGEMHEVFNMGCGFCVIVAQADETAATEALQGAYPGAQRIGRAADGPPAIRRG